VLKEVQRLGIGSFVQTKTTTIIETIEPGKRSFGYRRVVKLFSTAFKKIYGSPAAGVLLGFL